MPARCKHSLRIRSLRGKGVLLSEHGIIILTFPFFSITIGAAMARLATMALSAITIHLSRAVLLILSATLPGPPPDVIVEGSQVSMDSGTIQPARRRGSRTTPSSRHS